MRGKQHITIEARYVTFTLTVERNISIICGDSGTGKTSLHNILQEYIKLSGKLKTKVTASCNYAVIGSSFEMDIKVIKSLNNSIILIDEGVEYIFSVDFANLVKDSSNYFIIVTRLPIPTLPYSFKAIYKLDTVKRGTRYHTSNTPYYSIQNNNIIVNLVLTEDSNSGRQLMHNIVPGKVLEPKHNGKTTLHDTLKPLIDKSTYLVLADGAAIGSDIDKLSALQDSYPDNLVLWLPESFEELLLQSGIVWRGDVSAILESPTDQIESYLFLSWERFYTWLVTDIMKDFPDHEYSKKKLKPWYFEKHNLEKFINNIPDDILRCLGL